MKVYRTCLDCPAELCSEEKKTPRLRCCACQKVRNSASMYRSQKQRRERFGRYYTPMKPSEKRA